MGKSHFNGYFLSSIIFLSWYSIVATTPVANLETRAIAYFIKEVSHSDTTFKNITFFIPQYTSGTPSSLTSLAYITNDFNLSKNTLDNRGTQDSLNTFYKLLNRKIFIKSSNFKLPKKGIRYGVKVYNAVLYKKNYYVEIVLYNSVLQEEKVIFIQFFNKRPIKYYKKEYVLD